MLNHLIDFISLECSFNTHIVHLKAGEGDLLLIKEPALLIRCA